jgi:hypothetical protein
MASPNMFVPHMTRPKATPGHKPIHGAISINVLPGPLIIPPQLGVGGGIPNPRKLKLASDKITTPIFVEKRIIIEAVIFRNIWRVSILHVEQPMTCAADMYIFSLILITAPLIIREPPIPKEIPTTIII